MKTCWFFLFFLLYSCNGLNSSWRWQCEKGFCQKHRITKSTSSSALSLSACQLLCTKYAALWPYPTGEVSIGNNLIRLNVNSINIAYIKSEAASTPILRKAFKRFQTMAVNKGNDKARNGGGRSIFVNFLLDSPQLIDKIGINEKYTLKLSESSVGSLNVTIIADNIFGARHALETLNQLIIFDDLRDEILIPKDVQIKDGPAYPYRGILLDTSRNFITIEVIKRNIDAMAASKLNRFHWHITDSHSFPFYSQSHPQLSKLGAYSPDKVYTPDQIEDVVEYALVRGVKIVPEFDAPAHVGEGWQDTGYVVCLNQQPWNQYCVEPPCGQFDPTEEGLYDMLRDIYSDMIKVFKPDIFHMGGDEVKFECWKSIGKITKWMEQKGWSTNGTELEQSHVKLWDYFQTKALEKLDSVTENQKLPIIMWTSTLTEQEDVLKYLPKDRYIIQVWTKGNDNQIKTLLNKGYSLILSNYDALYFDCGFGGWVQAGNNWCSPYIGWQAVYENKPNKISEGRTDLIWGAEATLWTEQVDSSTVDGRFWPRAAAMAEVLWSEPETGWQEAETRMLIHRDRLVRDAAVNAEALEPEWCLQNDNNCPIKRL